MRRERGVNVAQGTQTAFKNELLYTTFGINYSTLPAIFRKVRLPHASTATSAALNRLVHVLKQAFTIGLAGAEACCHRVSC